MSSRIAAILIGLAAALLAVTLLLVGAFQVLDIATQRWFAFPEPPAPLPVILQMLCCLLFGLGSACVALDVEAPKIRRFLLATALLQPLSAVAVAALAQVWFSPFASLAAMLLAITGAMGWQRSLAGRQARRLQALFGQHLSAVSLDFLQRQPESGVLAPVAATVLVARAEESDWKSLQLAADFLKNHDAWVEVQAGHRLLALFNAPVHDERHAITATGAALEFLVHHPAWHLGLASGTLTCGIPAGEDAFQIDGELLDEAEALCVANRDFGSNLLVNLAAYDLAQTDFLLRPLGFLQTNGAEIFQPLASLESAPADLVQKRDHFWQGLILQRQQRIREALAAFRQAGDDTVTRHFLQRLEQSETRG